VSTDVAMREPWDRLEGEGVQAFDAFATYRDLGVERSTAKVAQACGKDKSLIDRWSGRYNWVQRTRAYDESIDTRARVEHEEKILEHRRKTARIGSQMLDVVGVEVDGMKKEQGEGDEKVPLKLGAQDTVRLAREGDAMVRRALGIPDQVQRVQVDHRGDPIVRAILLDEQTQEDAFAFLESAAAAAEGARRGDR
jgi:hypothetical protein